MSSHPISSSDSEFGSLVMHLKSGNKEALASLWRSFGSDLQRRARTRLRQYGLLGHTDSMDICNAVLLDLVRQREIHIHSPSDLMKYIRRAIDNQVRDEFKRLTRKRRDVRRNIESPVENQEIANELTSPSQVMIRNEIFDRLMGELGADGDRIVRLVMNGCSWEEVGNQVGMKPDAIRMKWNRAVRSIRGKMRSESGASHG